MIAPKHLVGTMLEADDLIPQSSEFSSSDIKDFVGDEGPSPVSGVPVRGHYADLWSKLAAARRKKDIDGGKGIKVARNTWLILHPNGRITVRFYNTDVITVEPNDTITVTTGGFKTVTTMARINEWLPGGWGLYRCDNDWWWNWKRDVSIGDKTFKITQPFNSNDTITAEGTLHPQEAAKYARTRKSRAV